MHIKFVLNALNSLNLQKKWPPHLLTFIPTTFWPLTSINWWSVNIPFLAAEESFTMDLIFPFLNTKPMYPWLSFCMVIVLSNGLYREFQKMIIFMSKFMLYRILKTYTSSLDLISIGT